MMDISLKGLPLPIIDKDAKAEDINRLGNLITRLLRAHATAVKNARKEA